MMICHGGIGVVQACLRAGIPCLVSPLMGDQFALAQLLVGRGLGAQCGTRLSDITTQDIINAYRVGEKCFARCRQISKSIVHDHSTVDPGLRAIVSLVTRLGS
jgi:UDP:flavonoid glycosyltransferase YjiC (YdhE family)